MICSITTLRLRLSAHTVRMEGLVRHTTPRRIGLSDLGARPLCALMLTLSSAIAACARSSASVVEKPATSRPPLASSASGEAPVQAEDLVTRTNAQRVALRLPLLMREGALMRAAQLQADQMAALNTMAHDLPGARYPSLDSRLEAVGYRMQASGENVAEGYASAAAVLAGWMTSPSHRVNIVSTAFTQMGAGVATASNGRRFHAQVFGTPR